MTGNNYYHSFYEQQKAYPKAVIHAYPQLGPIYLKTCIYLGFPTHLEYSEYQKRLPGFQAKDQDFTLIDPDEYEQAKVDTHGLCEGWKKRAEKLDTDQLRKVVKKFALLLKGEFNKPDSVFYNLEDIENATKSDLLHIYRYSIAEIEASMLEQAQDLANSDKEYILKPFEESNLGSSNHSESSNISLKESEMKSAVAKNSSDETINQDIHGLADVSSFTDDDSQSSSKQSNTTSQNTGKEKSLSPSTGLVKKPESK